MNKAAPKNEDFITLAIFLIVTLILGRSFYFSIPNESFFGEFIFKWGLGELLSERGGSGPIAGLGFLRNMALPLITALLFSTAFFDYPKEKTYVIMAGFIFLFLIKPFIDYFVLSQIINNIRFAYFKFLVLLFLVYLSCYSTHDILSKNDRANKAEDE